MIGYRSLTGLGSSAGDGLMQFGEVMFKPLPASDEAFAQALVPEPLPRTTPLTGPMPHGMPRPFGAIDNRGGN